jgi:5'-nucleotidase
VIAEAAHPLTADRRRESVLGDLVTDAQRAATGAQIALTNSGGIRAEIDAGPIRWREAYEVQPFDNRLYRLELDGRTLLAALENGASGEHGLVQVSGVRFTVDPHAQPGRRVRSPRMEDGRPVRLYATYSVTVNEFMFQGGDGYTMLADARLAENTGITDLDAFVHHLQEGLPQPIRYELQGRIRFLEDVPATRDAR